MFVYKRFANLPAMLAYAVPVAAAYDARPDADGKAFAEPGIYSDNNGLSHRAAVWLVCGDVTHVLQWNAYSEQADIDFVGKRSRVDARDAALLFVDQVQAAIEAAPVAPVAPVAADTARPINPARAALSRAVNRAIAEGAPRFVEIGYWERPCAAAGLESFRYRGPFGWIMIGAKDTADALKEAARSTDAAIEPGKLERWNGKAYESATAARPTFVCKRCESTNPTVYFAPVAISPEKSICTCYACADAAGYLTKGGDLKPGYSL